MALIFIPPGPPGIQYRTFSSFWETALPMLIPGGRGGTAKLASYTTETRFNHALATRGMPLKRGGSKKNWSLKIWSLGSSKMAKIAFFSLFAFFSPGCCAVLDGTGNIPPFWLRGLGGRLDRWWGDGSTGEGDRTDWSGAHPTRPPACPIFFPPPQPQLPAVFAGLSGPHTGQLRSRPGLIPRLQKSFSVP